MKNTKLIEYLNDSLARTLPLESFVTLFYAEIDTLSGDIEYISAGHPEGIVVRSRSGKIELIEPTAPILGSSMH